jgi:Rod binding domain-containing protein
MSKIAPVTNQPHPTVHAASPAKAGKAATDAKVHKAAQEFEELFVRQILSAAKVGGGGDGKKSGYEGMAVDAIASAVSGGGGLGLARQIEDAVARASVGAAKK